jgi:hypothetical protein
VPHNENEEEMLALNLTESLGLGTEDNPFIIYRHPHSTERTNLKHLRFVCMSDTHNQIDKLHIPHGDVFIHCGDAVIEQVLMISLISINLLVNFHTNTNFLLVVIIVSVLILNDQNEVQNYSAI